MGVDRLGRGEGEKVDEKEAAANPVSRRGGRGGRERVEKGSGWMGMEGYVELKIREEGKERV
jgi:hypothetical protein